MELTTYKKKRIIPKDWKEIKLGEEFKTSSGATPLSTKREYYEGGTISWINSGELDSPFIYKAANFITQKGFDNSSTTIYPQDTILVAMYGATAGKASLLKMEACTNQAICAILPNKDYSPEFIKYNLDTLYDHLVGLSSGSARDNLSQAGIKELKLIVPQTKREQESLVTILSLIDKKIELNRQINDNLEEMAKQLYDYWFVQFDFPNEEGKPYKSSGGAMVWNEKLKREIPQGWNISQIKDFMRIFTGKKDVSKAVPGNYKFFSCAPEPITSNEYIYDGYAVLVSGNGSYTGRVGFYKGKFDLYQRTYACVLDKEVRNISFFYYTLRYLFQPIYSGGKHGSSIPYIVLGDLADFRFVFNEMVCKKFVDIVTPMFDEQLLRLQEIEELTKQRDELLPLLMNGQASVNYHLSVLVSPYYIIYRDLYK